MKFSPLSPESILSWILLLAAAPSTAQVVDNLLWTYPPGNEPDFTAVFYEGNTVQLLWNPFVNDTSPYDLWITSYDYTVSPYAMFLYPDVDLTHSGSFMWKVNVSESELQQNIVKYDLRFKKPASPRTFYNESSAELYSPGFLVLMNATSSAMASSSAAATSGTSSTLATSTKGQTTVTVSSGASSGSSQSGGLTSGEKAGIGVGVGIGVLFALGVGLLLGACWRRRTAFRPKELANPPIYEKSAEAKVGELHVASKPVELPGSGGCR